MLDHQQLRIGHDVKRELDAITRRLSISGIVQDVGQAGFEVIVDILFLQGNDSPDTSPEPYLFVVQSGELSHVKNINVERKGTRDI